MPPRFLVFGVVSNYQMTRAVYLIRRITPTIEKPSAEAVRAIALVGKVKSARFLLSSFLPIVPKFSWDFGVANSGFR